MDPANRGIQGRQQLLEVRAAPPLLYLQIDWWRSRHLGLPLVLADQEDPAVPAVRGSLKILENLFHPLSRCSRALLSGLEVRPARADLEVLEFLEILANQEDLLFLSDHLVLEVHRYPSLLWPRSAPQVRGIRGLQADR